MASSVLSTVASRPGRAVARVLMSRESRHESAGPCIGSRGGRGGHGVGAGRREDAAGLLQAAVRERVGQDRAGSLRTVRQTARAYPHRTGHGIRVSERQRAGDLQTCGYRLRARHASADQGRRLPSVSRPGGTSRGREHVAVAERLPAGRVQDRSEGPAIAEREVLSRELFRGRELREDSVRERAGPHHAARRRAWTQSRTQRLAGGTDAVDRPVERSHRGQSLQGSGAGRARAWSGALARRGAAGGTPQRRRRRRGTSPLRVQGRAWEAIVSPGVSSLSVSPPALSPCSRFRIRIQLLPLQPVRVASRPSLSADNVSRFSPPKCLPTAHRHVTTLLQLADTVSPAYSQTRISRRCEHEYPSGVPSCGHVRGPVHGCRGRSPRRCQ